MASSGKSEDSVNFGFGAGRPGSAAADELWEALLEQRKVLLERKSQLQTTLSVLDCEEADIRGSVECENSSAPTVATSYPIASDPLPFDVVSSKHSSFPNFSIHGNALISLCIAQIPNSLLHVWIKAYF